MASFQLSKWYLDCVTDSGDVSIAYTGKVHWGRLHVHYSSLLESTVNQVKVRHSIRACNEPEVKQDSVCWRGNVFRVDGYWQADSAELRETILRCEQGLIEWRCLMPRARATFGFRSGWGYAEHLRMSIPPWQLPIETLRWGRFSNPTDWVVWMDWQGEYSRRIVYWNGKPVQTEKLQDERIRLVDGTTLCLDRSLVIRDGPLGTTTLSAIPGLGKTLPAGLLKVHESKWRSRARLQRPNGLATEGWAIHERVTWPR
jgi:hypothetical protein